VGEKGKAEFLEIKMQYSVVRYKKVIGENSDLRIDGEYFKPSFLESDDQLNRGDFELLESLADVRGGKRLPLGETFSKEGVPYIRAEDIRSFADYSQSPKISMELHNVLRNYQTKYNDILVTIVGNSVGDVGIVKFKLDKCNLTENCAKIVNIKKVLPEYLFTYLSSKYGQNQIQREKVGTAQPKLALVRIRKFKVAILSDNFQETIKNLVDAAYTLNQTASQEYHQAERILLSELGLAGWKPKRQLSFVKNFSDAHSADRIDADYFQPMYDELLEKVREYWNGCERLGDLVSMKKCIEPGSEAYQENGIPFLRVSNLSKFGINRANMQYLSESLYEQLKTHQPRKGEILLSKDATPGIAFYLNNEPERMIPSGGILRLKVKDVNAIYPEYLTIGLNSFVVQKQIERDIGGSVINHWLVDQVEKTLIPALPGPIQKDISDKVENSFMKREQSKKLLYIAKCGVEIAIEQNEEEAEKWLNNEVNHASSSVHLESR